MGFVAAAVLVTPCEKRTAPAHLTSCHLSTDQEFLRNTGLAMERLISPKQMGEMYKFMAITPEHSGMVATGFSEAAAIAEQGFDVQLSTEEPHEAA